MKIKKLVILAIGYWLMVIVYSQNSLEGIIWLEKIKGKIGFKGIVARVGDTPIFADSIYNKITPVLYKMKKVTNDDNVVKTGGKLFRKELQRVLDIEIVDNYAKSKSIYVTDEELEKELKNTINRLGGMSKFNKHLKKVAISYDEFKKGLRFNILGKKVYQSVFTSENGFFTNTPVDNFVKPEEIKLYYETHKNEFYRQPRIRGIWIVKEFKNDYDKKNIIQYMKSIVDLVKQGYSFYKIHKLYSDEVQPLTWKFYPLNIFSKELYEKIENLQRKEGFHVFVVGNKVYLFNIKKYKKGKQDTLFSKNVYEKIYYTIYSDKITTMVDQIKNEIKNNISVKVYINE